MKNIILILFLLITNQSLSSQELLPIAGGEYFTVKESNCLTRSQRQDIQMMLHQNKAELERKGIGNRANLKNKMIVSFDWPLQKAAGLSFNSYYSTNNFVDQDTGAGIEDYNCDARSYNGHNGTDIDTWPFPWYLYDNDFVEVIAGEAGMITGKTDGNDDDHCSASGTWNAVFIEHADGSTAWYGHLKKNSLTSKTVGQSVTKGEYLGVVASSGFSTAPHLHFEVYDNASNLIDPYSGACNVLNASSWWASQPANREPTLNALLTHDAAPVHGCPGTNESPNMSNAFAVGQTIYMAAYYHDQLSGDASSLRVRKPDNSIWQSWSHTSPSTYTKSWWLWNWTLPASGPYGTWTFEIDYKGQTYSHGFEFVAPLPVELVDFEARKNKDNILLTWNTASEINNSGFEIQKSDDGESWKIIGFEEGRSNSIEINEYKFTDKTPFFGMNYYRLKQVDFDGVFEYSKVISVSNRKENEIEIYPNPTSGKLEVVGVEITGIKIVDRFGRIVKEQLLPNSNIDISELPDGLYFISMKTEKGVIIKRIIKE